CLRGVAGGTGRIRIDFLIATVLAREIGDSWQRVYEVLDWWELVIFSARPEKRVHFLPRAGRRGSRHEVEEILDWRNRLVLEFSRLRFRFHPHCLDTFLFGAGHERLREAEVGAAECGLRSGWRATWNEWTLWH